MNENITLSVVMISYRHEAFIAEAIDSILNQKANFPIELIIADDCSPDNTEQVINSFKEHENYQWIKFTKHSTNKGMMGNFVWALSQSKSKYTAICEGDDFWTDPNKLQKQVDYLEANPDCILTGHDAKIVDNKSQLVKESKLPDYQKRDANSEELKLGFWVLTISMVFRNIDVFSTFPTEGFNAKNGDTFLVSLLGQSGYFHYMPEILPAAYRVHDGGVWSTKNTAHKDFNAMTTKFYMGEYYKKKKDPIATKIYTSAVSKGISLFNEQRKELDQFDKNQKKQYLKMMTKSHLQVYGWLKSIKFIINKYAWYYLKN